jgi:hypothetical protein
VEHKAIRPPLLGVGSRRRTRPPPSSFDDGSRVELEGLRDFDFGIGDGLLHRRRQRRSRMLKKRILKWQIANGKWKN